MRIDVQGASTPIQRGEPVVIEVDGQPLEARAGETIATALLAQGRRTLRHTRLKGKPRGLFCAMGICFDCIVTVNGQNSVRACMATVEPGLRVTLPGRFVGED
jgi:predicted molibdopterin-dependent oxidoreductase YjgC